MAKYHIGIDPGKNTGFAVWNRITRQFEDVCTTDFWGAYMQAMNYPQSDTQITVELPRTTHVWTDSKCKTGLHKTRAFGKVSANVGGVIREAELLIDGLRKAGYDVKTVHPLGKVDSSQFKRVTGYTGRTNEHSRDAGMMVYGS